ncbi:MAG TPA: hypothetical protein VEA99_11765 [Gemmatimonadaceae bacterium]|nr:hypothetical protein [Gemmatimonadaceae bacterium]
MSELHVDAESLRVQGGAIVYRLHDVGYELHLDRALDRLAASAPERVRPVRGEAQAIQIKHPPVAVVLGTERVTIGGRATDVEVSARLYSFGVISLRARLECAGEPSWSQFIDFGDAVESAPLDVVFAHHLRLLLERIGDAVERPQVSAQREDYIVFRVDRLLGAHAEPAPASVLRDAELAPLLLNERRVLSAAARAELLPHRFSYYPDDLAVLTWDNALVVDPEPGETDVEFLLEFANAQLLELRYYDALLDAELPRMYERTKSVAGPRLFRRYGPLLAELQTLVAESTEIVEQAENALKVTDDVYLARVYLSALEIFRARAWRTGIDRKLAIIRETYQMLNAQGQAARSEALELAIVLLIVLEIVLAFAVRL